MKCFVNTLCAFKRSFLSVIFLKDLLLVMVQMIYVYIPEEQPDELLVVVLDGPVDGCEAGEVADGGGEGGAGGQLAPHRRHVAAAEVQQPRDVRLGPLPLAPSQGLAGHLGPWEHGGCSKELSNTFDY